MHKYIKSINRDYRKKIFELHSKELIIASAVKIYVMMKKKFQKYHPDIDERKRMVSYKKYV